MSRIWFLFGTDFFLASGTVDEYTIESFLTHTRFIHKLRLHYDVLQKVAYENSEKLFGLEPIRIVNKGNIRP